MMFNYEASIERLQELQPEEIRELYNQTYRGITEEEALEIHRIFLIMATADPNDYNGIMKKIEELEKAEDTLEEKYGEEI